MKKPRYGGVNLPQLSYHVAKRVPFPTRNRFAARIAILRPVRSVFSRIADGLYPRGARRSAWC